MTTTKGVPLFKLHTVFNCVIGAQEAHWGGVYKFRTTSIITSRQLYSGLMHLSQLTNGILVGLPLYLLIRPVQVSPDGKATTVYVVHVEMRGKDMSAIMDRAVIMAKMLVERSTEMRSLGATYRKMLVAPGFEPQDEQAEINQEFQPETTGDEAAPPDKDEFWSQVIAAKKVEVTSEGGGNGDGGEAAQDDGEPGQTEPDAVDDQEPPAPESDDQDFGRDKDADELW